MVGRIPTRRRLPLVAVYGSPAKAIPVLAAFACSVACKTDVEFSIVAASTVVMEFVLGVLFSTALALY